ncbi:hypothetical protein CPT_Muldoon_210 [Serratia phage Muldoon]|uniref:Uncharacterized protein n=1 Tax=Serratia phage Muldoon TaxID=2601678 RepID=A0A5P8PHJ7_9CAUD|nr:hypothetical protein HYP94_gp180 [Serratia phage Muldoon]QFR56161.1 hypothetical protein CPT_Muldoon_210 [Serratia phage Muldoon]
MKILIAAAVVTLALLGAVVIAMDIENVDTEKQTDVIGITVSGKVGVHVNEALCVNPLTTQVEVCF